MPSASASAPWRCALIGAIPRARLGGGLAPGGVAGALRPARQHAAGQWLGQFIPERALIIGFCLLVLWSAAGMWRGASLPAKENAEDRYPALLGIGLVGLLSGLMGVGGGFLIVPALLWFTSLSLLSAMATSMAVIAVVSGGGFLYLTDAEPPLALLGGAGPGWRVRRAVRQSPRAVPQQQPPSAAVRTDVGARQPVVGDTEAAAGPLSSALARFIPERPAGLSGVGTTAADVLSISSLRLASCRRCRASSCQRRGFNQPCFSNAGPAIRAASGR